MSKTKAVIEFSRYKGPELDPVAGAIHAGMTENAAIFPNPTVAMNALEALIGDFKAKLAAKASRATADILAANTARRVLTAALADLGGYVNFIAQGDPLIVAKSGFPSYTTARPPSRAVPAAPQNLRLRHGVLSTTIVARHRPDRPRSMNHVQTCTGDPDVEENWKDAGIFSGGTAVIGGLTVGVTIWVRVRTAGRKGAMGAWSDPAKITVI